MKNEADITRLARFKVYEGMEKFESDDRVGAEGCFQKAVAMAPNFGLSAFLFIFLHRDPDFRVFLFT